MAVKIKRPSAVTEIMAILRVLYPTHPLAEVNRNFEPFPSLISGILSSRTKDTTTIVVMQKLLSRYDSPEKMLILSAQELDSIIYPVGFHSTKAKQILATCQILIENYSGMVPDTYNELIELPGVGRKIANLILDTVFGKAYICVDTHVHRITQRLGWHTAKSVEATEENLMQILVKPKEWREINRVMVNLGQNICLPVKPRCKECPIEHLCPRTNI